MQDVIRNLCRLLAISPISGKVSEAPSPGLVSAVNLPAEKIPSFAAIMLLFNRVEIFTRLHDIDLEPFERMTLKEAHFYVDGVERPLIIDLRPGHLARPMLPSQLFRVNEEEGCYEAVSNPYFNGDVQQLLLHLSALYIGLAYLTGMPEPFNNHDYIASVVISPADASYNVNYAASLSPLVLEEYDDWVLDTFDSEPDDHLQHFIEHFMPGMAQKTEHRLKDLGNDRLQNDFSPGPWSAEDLAKPISELLNELSMETRASAPIHISHRERLDLYIRNYLQELDIAEFPLTVIPHGMDAADWKDLQQVMADTPLINSFREALLDFFNEDPLTLGDLLDRVPKPPESLH